MKKTTMFAVSLQLFLALCACQNNTIKLQSGDEDEADNFTLYVSNQSFDASTVDVQILIDGKVIVDEFFEVGNQHIRREYRLYLSSGKHILKALTKRGEAELRSEFIVTNKHWAAVSYWYYPDTHHNPTPRQFTFIIQDTPILFL